MKTALILHGVCPEEEFFFSKYPSPSNAWWLPWLQQQFLRAGWQCQTPELPHPYRPSYAEWKETFECFKPQKLSLLVGHSAGGGFAIKYLQEHKLKLEKLILVAPWLDPEREFDDFLQTDLKPTALNSIDEVHLIFSEDDDEAERQTKDRLLAAYPQIVFHDYLNFGHFTAGKTGRSFQELWNLCRLNGQALKKQFSLNLCGIPAADCHVDFAFVRKDRAFRCQQSPLSGIGKSHAAVLINDPLPGNVIFRPRLMQSITDGARRMRTAGQPRRLSVVHDLSPRNPPHDGKHSLIKVLHLSSVFAL